MARITGRKFDMRVAREWRNRYLAGETCMSIGRSVEPPLSDAMVYYHISKFGTLPRKKRGPVPKPPAPCAEESVKARMHIAAEPLRNRIFGNRHLPMHLVAKSVQPAEKSMFGAPSIAAMMAGRARIPRRVERMQGVDV